MSDMSGNNNWSHGLPDPYLNWGNGFSMPKNENIAANGSSSMTYHNIMPSSNTYSSSSSSSDLANYRTADLVASCYPYMHHSSASRSSLIPQNYMRSGSYYNQITIRGSTSASNSQRYYEKAHFKRKSSAHPMDLDMMNSHEYYRARSSNGLAISSDQFRPNPILGPCWSHSSISIVPGYRSNGLLTIGEGPGSHRNVRSRHGHALQLENNLVGPNGARSSLPHHFHQIASTSGYGAMSLDSFRRFPTSAEGFFHHEINQPIVSSNADTVMEIDEGFSSNLVTSRHTATSLPTLPSIPTQDGVSNRQQQSYYSSASGYSTAGLPVTDDIRPSGNHVAPHLRHQRLSSRIQQNNSERNGRMRSLYDSLIHRMSTQADEGYTHGRWAAEDALMLDSPVFYDSHVMLDRHRDMRVDADNMSYEELLALGERIGNVNTGLSEDEIKRCLTRRFYSFDQDQDAEKESCVICLEEYEDGHSIGRLNCRHDYHSSCIKKWLIIKNACPICKAAALADTHKGKQVLLM